MYQSKKLLTTTDSLYQRGGVRNITKNDFKRLLEVCVNDNHFISNNQHYQQFEGFAMGSPLSAIMANIFLCHHEQKWLEDCPIDFRPLLYRRYVDGCFIAFRKRDVEPFYNNLNSKHLNIKFTKEHENENKLEFSRC